MRKHTHALILSGYFLLLIAPLLTQLYPLEVFSPDITYVKGKILQVMQGNLFTDPVTGYYNFHPAIYHMILAPFAILGISLNGILWFVSLSNIALFIFFSYKLAATLFDRTVALLTCLTIPYLFNGLGPGYMNLATAFYFSAPIYLAGLWLYMEKRQDVGKNILTGFLWGLAFIISPTYLFLIGLALLYELVVRRHGKRFAYLAVPFGVMLIPFLIQAYIIYSSNLTGTSAFSFWRGLPDWDWLKGIVTSFFTGWGESPAGISIVFALIIVTGGVLAVLRMRKNRFMVGIIALAWLFTSYHFTTQYAGRIELFLSLLLVMHLIAYLWGHNAWRQGAFVGVLVVTGYGCFWHLSNTLERVELQKTALNIYQMVAPDVENNLGRFIKPGDYVLASEETYRYFILPNFPVHGLQAYRSGEYFQLNAKIAEDMSEDYEELIHTTDPSVIDYICNKYGISVAVMGGRNDFSLPGLKTLLKSWKIVYSSTAITILQRPGTMGDS